jgi:hypothetical protein
LTLPNKHEKRRRKRQQQRDEEVKEKDERYAKTFDPVKDCLIFKN